MVLFFFFVNKPITAAIYAILWFFIFALSYFDWVVMREGGAIGIPIFLGSILTFHYLAILIYWFLFRTNDKIMIRGVDFRFLKTPLLVTIVTISWAFLFAAFCVVKFKMPMFAGVIGFFIFSGLFFIFVGKYCEAKVLSEILKHNKTIEDFDLKAIYADIREVLVNKIVKTKG